MVERSATVRARIDPELKMDAEAILKVLGLSMSELITMTLHQLILQRGLPFDARIQNTETLAAMERVKSRQGLQRYDSLADLIREVDDELAAGDRSTLQAGSQAAPPKRLRHRKAG